MPCGVRKKKNGKRGLVKMEITPALSGSQFPLADVTPKSPRFRYGMREPADILSCEFSLLNCDFDRAAKKAVDALRAQRYSDSLNHPNF